MSTTMAFVRATLAALLISSASWGQTGDFVLTPTNVAAFEYGDHTHRIWASLRNPTDQPTVWQFRFEPLFMPEINAEGEITIKVLPLGQLWRVQLPIILDNSRSRALAARSVKDAYPKHSAAIQPSSIFALDLRRLKIEIPELAEFFPRAKLVDESLDFSSPTPDFLVKINVPTSEEANLLAQQLPEMRIEYSMNFAAKKPSQNRVSIAYSELKSSRLFIELDGIGSNEVFVHRDDLRRLSEDIREVGSFDGLIEEPERFDEEIFERVLRRLTESASSAAFDEAKWNSTYNAADLRPDYLTRELNKVFKKDTGETQWKRHGKFDSNAKANVFEIVDAGGGMNVELDDEGLKKFLKERNIETEIEGNRIVVKSIDLQRVNLSEFERDSRFTSIITYVSSESSFENRGTIDLSRTRTTSGAVDLAVRVRDLERDVGTLRSDAISRIDLELKTIKKDLTELDESISQPEFFSLASGKGNRGNVGPESLGEHRFCALSSAVDVHGDYGCGCVLKIDDKNGEWMLTVTKEKVTNEACRCAAVCLG